MKRKWFAPMVFTLALSVGLAGCGGGGAAPTPEKTSPSGETPAPAAEKITVTVTSWRADQIEHDTYANIQEELNKVHPEIVLKYQPVKATEYNTTLNTALKTDTAADIIHLRPYAAGRALADAGYLEPIDGLPGLDIFTEKQLAASSGTDGKVYGVPYMLSSTQILYNKKIFEKYGLTEPKTWDEFIQTAEALKSNSVTPLAFGSKEGWVLSLMHGAIGPQFYGLDFIDRFIKGEVTLNSPEYLKSIEAMNSLTPYFPANFEGLGMEDIRTMFATEQTGMVINGHFEIASILSLNPNIEIGAFPVPPVDPNGKASISTWVDGSFAVNKKAKNIDAVKKVLEFMTSQAYGTIILNRSKAPSPIPGVTTDDELINEIAQLSSTNSTPYFAVSYLNSGNPTTKATLETSLQGMYLKKLTPQQVVEEVQASVETWFKPSAQ
jgi:raffinose/stachyose/melibiose transport system substrate-binding protein